MPDVLPEVPYAILIYFKIYFFVLIFQWDYFHHIVFLIADLFFYVIQLVVDSLWCIFLFQFL